MSARSWSRLRGSAVPSLSASACSPAAMAVRRRWMRWASTSGSSAMSVAMPLPPGCTTTRREANARTRLSCAVSGQTRRRAARANRLTSAEWYGRRPVASLWWIRVATSSMTLSASCSSRSPTWSRTSRPAHAEIAADSTSITSRGWLVSARAVPIRLPMAGMEVRRACASSSRAGSWIRCRPSAISNSTTSGPAAVTRAAAARAANQEAHASQAAAVTTWQAHGQPEAWPGVGQSGSIRSSVCGTGHGPAGASSASAVARRGPGASQRIRRTSSCSVVSHQESSVQAGRSSRHHARSSAASLASRSWSRSNSPCGAQLLGSVSVEASPIVSPVQCRRRGHHSNTCSTVSQRAAIRTRRPPGVVDTREASNRPPVVVVDCRGADPADR